MTLIFVYNADTGPWNALIDSVHKIVSPDTYACDLCAITYGPLSMDREWRAWLKTLASPARFFHRDDFKAVWPDVNVKLPAILIENKGSVEVLVAAEDFSASMTVSELIAFIEARLGR